MRISHLTSVHSRHDTRIFIKQCCSLAKAGYSVSLIVADGNGNEILNDVTIIDVGSSRGRLSRMIKTTRKVYDKALALDAEVYHLHDPELIPVGLKLKKLGKKVIFDSHEDVPKQMLSKPYLNAPAKWILSKTFALYERYACSQLDVIIAATPSIWNKFQTINTRSVNINNYPMLGELAAGEINWALKKNQVCYVGVIARVRGILDVVKAMGAVEKHTRLQLAGKFSEVDVEQAAHAEQGWSNVDALGFLNREQVSDVLQQSVAGLVTFHPAPNHTDAQPNKMFEYMSAGVPVIASHFPLWKDIIQGNNCGLCVDPFDSAAIGKAIKYLVSHPEEAEQMGKNGRKAVEQKYNWGSEEGKLLELYEGVLN